MAMSRAMGPAGQQNHNPTPTAVPAPMKAATAETTMASPAPTATATAPSPTSTTTPAAPSTTTPAGPPGWTADAEQELKKIPFFVRGKARRNTERFALDRGLAAITLETLYEAKAHFRS
jgi:light-independent protochlorophyllide reductase subunit B